MNKKATEKIFSIWWFISLALVGVVITTVVVNFFSSPIDVRAQEIAILQEKILDCVVKNGYLESRVLTWGEDDLFNKCNLNKESFKEEKNTKLFVNLIIKNETKEELKKFRFGEVSYEENCLIKQKGMHMPLCSETKLFVNFFNETENKKESFIIDILVASQNHGIKRGFLEK